MQAKDIGVPANQRYRLTATPIGRGSYAEVFHAVSREDGSEVALKRAFSSTQAHARIRREIEAQRSLAHPSIMPIWDYDQESGWYAMPLAKGTLYTLRRDLDEDDLVSVLTSISGALSIAHQKQLIHRDVSPANILALPGSTSGALRWVVADWGMVQRPYGTGSPALTRTGQRMGTPGFDAPELDTDPRNATPAADVYSLGRIAAWFLADEQPRSGIPLLPSGEALHWRPFVRACTYQEVADRVRSMDDLRALLRDVFVDKDAPARDRAAQLLERALSGEEEGLNALLSLAETYPEDAELFIDQVANLPRGRMHGWISTNPDRAAQIAIVMARHTTGTEWGDRDDEYVATPLSFVLGILRTLIETNNLGPAQDAAADYFVADSYWAYDPQRRRTMEWLAELEDHAGRAMARSMAGRNEVISYYSERGWQPRSVVLGTLLAT